MAAEIVDKKHLSWLINCSSNDINFISHVQTANGPTVRAALAKIPELRGSHVTRQKALERRLRVLEREAKKND
jgi:hypothetical protein